MRLSINLYVERAARFLLCSKGNFFGRRTLTLDAFTAALFHSSLATYNRVTSHTILKRQTLNHGNVCALGQFFCLHTVALGIREIRFESRTPYGKQCEL